MTINKKNELGFYEDPIFGDFFYINNGYFRKIEILTELIITSAQNEF